MTATRRKSEQVADEIHQFWVAYVQVNGGLTPTISDVGRGLGYSNGGGYIGRKLADLGYTPRPGKRGPRAMQMDVVIPDIFKHKRVPARRNMSEPAIEHVQAVLETTTTNTVRGDELADANFFMELPGLHTDSCDRIVRDRDGKLYAFPRPL